MICLRAGQTSPEKREKWWKPHGHSKRNGKKATRLARKEGVPTSSGRPG